MHNVISGSGQFHTNEVDPNKVNRTLKPYESIGLNGIRMLVDNPRSTSKAMAQWIIPSSLHSRSFEGQAKNGIYHFLWADLDEQPKPLANVKEVLEKVVDGDFEVYTTSSATQDKPKSRILIPLANPLLPADWVSCQGVLNKLLSQHGITPDKANERYAQLCYLPNRGQYYKSVSQRDDIFFNPLISWEQYRTCNLSTESTDDYRGLLKSTEITEVIHSGGHLDIQSLPSSCSPTSEGQRNNCLFQLVRFLKSEHPNAELAEIKPYVILWHRQYLDVIGTSNFLETWTDFTRGWDKVKVPYGQSINSVLEKIDMGTPIPQALIDMGYDNRAFKLLLICRQLQIVSGENPFFISARTAGEMIDYHFTGASKMLASMVMDGILHVVSKGSGLKASRYKYIWQHPLEV
jgi:hypothetical protein